jgi:hypothetical protein
MKKILLIGLILLVSVSLYGCVIEGNGAQAQKVNQSDEEAVLSLVKSFGSKLQLVSLQASEEIVKKTMEENYGEYVSQELLAKWSSDPLNAPGRLTSSPWPDRIEILSVEKIARNEYKVKGEVIEITSAEQVSGGVAAKRQITLTVKKTDKGWLIDEVVLGAYEEKK